MAKKSFNALGLNVHPPSVRPAAIDTVGLSSPSNLRMPVLKKVWEPVRALDDMKFLRLKKARPYLTATNVPGRKNSVRTVMECIDTVSFLVLVARSCMSCVSIFIDTVDWFACLAKYSPVRMFLY